MTIQIFAAVKPSNKTEGSYDLLMQELQGNSGKVNKVNSNITPDDPMFKLIFNDGHEAFMAATPVGIQAITSVRYTLKSKYKTPHKIAFLYAIGAYVAVQRKKALSDVTLLKSEMLSWLYENNYIVLN